MKIIENQWNVIEMQMEINEISMKTNEISMKTIDINEMLIKTIEVSMKAIDMSMKCQWKVQWTSMKFNEMQIQSSMTSMKFHWNQWHLNKNHGISMTIN